MKKLFLLAAAMLAFASCDDDEVVVPDEPKVDEVSVLPKSKDFENTGGDVSVMVTSTGEWTVGTKENATYDWVSADKTKGADGEMIKFTVDANESEETRFAYYVFTCGKATSEFKITQVAGEQLPTTFVTIDEKELTRDFNAGRWEVMVKYSEDIDYRGLQSVIPEDATWFKHVVTLEGEEAGTAKMVFEYEAWDGFAPREVAFTVNYGELSVPMKMTQAPEAKIIPEFPLYTLEPIAGTLQVKVESSVAYNAEVITEDGSASWLTDYALTDGVNSWSYSDFDGKRKATIRFTEAVPAEGAEPIVAEVQVIQSRALITTVARMNKYRAVFAQDAANKDLFKLGKNITVEFLINPDEGSFSQVSAMFGIERRFLIRHSDGSAKGTWELVYAKTRQDYFGEYYEGKVQGSMLEANKWIHIAVTVKSTNNTDGEIHLYQDGKEVNWTTFYDMKDIDLSEIYRSNSQQQEFALGYAYDNSRFFNGLMSEVRVWNRALTAEEINAENHFYQVDPASEGLVAYWKLNDGEGFVIKDHSPWGNNLVGQKNMSPWTDTDMVWENVSLPE